MTEHVGVHEAADGVLTRLEADRLRARALELVAELDLVDLLPYNERSEAMWRWAGRASRILAEVARG